MIDTEVSFTSLCYIFEDYSGKVWLQRLADIEDGSLHAPFRSERSDNYYENRERLYRNDGPDALGTVGIWDWTAIPNRDNPAIDYVQSYYVKNLSPTRIVVLTAKSLEEVVEQLKKGTVRTQSYFCDTVFCYEPKWGQFVGVLCHANEFIIKDRHAKLLDNVYSLPCFTFKTSDIYNWDDYNLRFYRQLQLGDPSGHVSIGNADEIIRSVVLERSTWTLFKECIGATKTEWRNSKTLLERICNPSLYEIIIQKLKCTPEQAKQAVDDFVTRARTVIDAGDIDADVLARIAMQHDDLRAQCEKIVSEKWQKDHDSDIAKAEAELVSLRNNASQEAAAAKLQLSEIQKDITSAEAKRDGLLSEIATAQSKFDHLVADIDQYETLGKDTVAAVQKKIAEAQKDMAGFIADLSVFLPQPQATLESGKRISLWQYECAPFGTYSDEDADIAESWDDEVNTINQNLAHSLSVDSAFCSMLSAFLYAAHINNVPLLFVGPAGQDIAEVVSVSLYANSAGHLTLGNECAYDAAEEIMNYSENIVSVRNMFGKGWSDEFPQTFTKLKKQVIWTHPYVEDMVIEPKGLYNYMLPVLSECFVGAIPALNPWPGKRAEKFIGYVSKKKQPLRIAAFKRLGFSKLVLNQLTLILSDAKAILDNPSSDKDLEVLFGVLPLCVLTGRLDILKDIMETESGISNSVKTEAARYIEEV